MKILVLVKHGYGESGGIARYTQDFLNAISSSSQQAEVTILAQISPQANKDEIPSGIGYITVDLKNKFSYLISLLKISFKERFNYIVCTHLYLLPATFLLKFFRGTKVICVIYGIEAWNPKNLFSPFYTQLIDRVLSISNLTLERFLSWAKVDPGKTSILTPAVDKSFCSSNSSTEALLSRYDLKNKLVILTVGSLHPDWSKGHDILIDTLPRLLKSYSNLVYIIAGSGNDRERLENKVASLGLRPYVHFIGFVDEKEKSACYQMADVFFMAGLGEGFGIVYLEALACGLPVVASKLDASAEVLSNLNTGILVDPNSSAEVEQAILKSLLKEKIVPIELDQYSIENFQKKIDRMLEDLANDRL